MAFCEFHWSSGVLQKQVATNVILPDTGKPPFPVYYLLHGLSDDYTAWLRRTRIEIYAAAYPMIVVMPDGFRGFYTNNDQGPPYAEYIARELPAMIERTFAAIPAREGRCIGGLSMGGYGALRAALGYPDRFISANSHSGALMNGSRQTPPLRIPEARSVFGDHPAGSDHDLLHLARQCRQVGTVPQIRIDCGSNDFLLADNREFHRGLDEIGIAHEYQEFPGDHNWDYWDTHVREALAFHAKILKLITPGT
jgi:S-formylglutathione hydrolase FrmB